MTDLETQKRRAADWFKTLQDDIISRFESLEDEADRPLYTGEPGRFEKTEWSRGDGSEDLGGGRMLDLTGPATRGAKPRPTAPEPSCWRSASRWPRMASGSG